MSRSTPAGLEAVAIDAETFEALRQLDAVRRRAATSPEAPPTVDEVLDTLERAPREEARWRRRRIRSGVALPTGSRSSAGRDSTGAQDSVEFLKQLLELARALVGAERAEAEGDLDEFEVLDPDRGRADADPRGVRAARTSR